MMGVHPTDLMTAARRHAETFLPGPLKAATVKLTRPDPWPIVAREPKTHLFIHIPRTAGGSVRTALGMPRSGHVPAYVYAKRDPAAFAAAFKFAFVRNPWDRFISAYHRVIHTAKNPLTEGWGNRNVRRFEDFDGFVEALEDPLFRWNVLSYPHFRPQHEWVEVDGAPAMDFLGRFETLDEDYLKLREIVGVSQDLDHVHQSPHKDYRSYYTDRSAELVGRLYQGDAERYGYRFG